MGDAHVLRGQNDGDSGGQEGSAWLECCCHVAAFVTHIYNVLVTLMVTTFLTVVHITVVKRSVTAVN